MRNATFKHLGLLAALGLVPACATLSSNIGGDFSCPAPKGRCAPASVIDAEALGALASPPKSGATAASTIRPVAPQAQRAARTGETILRIVLPAHVDTDGLLHDEAAVYAVVAQPHWVAEQDRPAAKSRPRDAAKRISQANKAAEAAPRSGDAAPTPGDSDRLSPTGSIDDAQTDAQPDIFLSRESAPLTLREAIAGRSSPAIEGFAHSPLPRTPQLFPGQDAAPEGLLSTVAIDAARQGHRIGDIVPTVTAPVAGAVAPPAPAGPAPDAKALSRLPEADGTKNELHDQSEPRQ
jgi:conjugal transfer pilus assembly protein TraV